MHIQPNKDPGIFDERQLSNGVKVFYKQSDTQFGAPKVAGCILVKVGGRDDPKGKEGSAHFFEHMPFRGTKNFPSLKELTEPIENNGGYMNAFTSDEVTGYEVVVPAKMLEDGIARIFDMLTTPQLREAEIEIEREVIMEELKNKQSSVGWYANQELLQHILGDHPIVNAVLGSEESLRSINKQDLADFHKKYYHAGNITLFFAGTFDVDALMEMCEKYFSGLPTGEKTVRDVSYTPKLADNQTIVLNPDKYNRSVYLTGRAFPAADFKQATLLKIYGDMLGRGMTSPLFKAIREEKGLAYNIGVRRSFYADVAIFRISVSTQFKNMDQVEAIVWDLLPKVLADEARFNEIKHAITQGAIHTEYSVGALVDDVVDDVADFERPIGLNEYLELLNSMTIEDLKSYVAPLIERKDYLTVRVNCDDRA